MQAANNRYFAFMACIDNPDANGRWPRWQHRPRPKAAPCAASNLFLDPDYRLFLARGDRGFRAADLRTHVNGLSRGAPPTS